MKKNVIHCCKYAGVFIIALYFIPLQARTVSCQTTPQITSALSDAQPGDTIVVKAGTYVSGGAGSITMSFGTVSPWFFSRAQGTKTAPIVFKGEDPSHPPVLEGAAGSLSTGYVFWLNGGYWEIRDISFRTAQKGIVLDSASHSRLIKIDISNVGQEGIHLRNGSSYCLLESCTVHETGRVDAGYGEGIYVGSDNGKWTTYTKDCNYNRITGCTLGPGIAAEHVDIKEGTSNTIVEYCTFHGAGISGQNGADGFIDAKGNNSIIQYNTGFRENNAMIVNAFQVHQQVAGWGLNDTFIHNDVNLDDSTSWVVDAPTGTAFVGFNNRVPGGNMYRGKFTSIDRARVGDYYTWDPLMTYRAGDTVFYSAHIWAAKFYTIGAEPGSASDTKKSWLDLGAYAGTGVRSSATLDFSGVRVSRSGTRIFSDRNAPVVFDVVSLSGRHSNYHSAKQLQKGWQSLPFPQTGTGTYVMTISDGKTEFCKQRIIVVR